MKRLLVALIASAVIVALAQSPVVPGVFPRDVVEQFVKMDVEGARLTPQGWHDADALFINASETSQPKILVVIGKHHAVSTAAEGNADEFFFGYEEIGRINISSLRFAPTSVEWWSFEKYKVVADAHRTSGADRRSDPRIDAPPEWKIDGVQPKESYVTKDVAIRYLTQARNNVNEASIKKNADQTLAKLRKLH